MANLFTTQIIKDTEKMSVIKFTAIFDGSGQESNVVKIQGSALKGALDTNNNLYSVTSGTGGVKRTNYNFTSYRIVYDVKIPSGYLLITWDGVTPAPIAILGGTGDTNSQKDIGTVTNNATTPNGNVNFTTTGALANCSYTVVMEIHKDNRDYNAGQIQSPGSFNYPPYGITP